jgi:hypothetical protein
MIHLTPAAHASFSFGVVNRKCRDPVRSSKDVFVKTRGLRWTSMQLLAPLPGAQRVWAVPFLTVLAPSERSQQKRGVSHKTLTDWGRPMLRHLRRWLPERVIVAVADSTYASLDLLGQCQHVANPIVVVPRSRLDAALYAPPPERTAKTKGRPLPKGKRQPTAPARLTDAQTAWQHLTVQWYSGSERTIVIATGTARWYHSGMPTVPLRWVLIRDPEGKFDPQALLWTDPTVAPQQAVEWFVLRWRLDITFHEARTSLGIETQRQ